MDRPAMTQLLLGPELALNVTALIEARVLVQANSGGGKSYAIRKICELVHGTAQVIVLDVEGEFHTLREKFDFTLVSADKEGGGDAIATVEHAADLARTLLEGRISAVIDIYDLGAKRAAFIGAFLEGIMLAPRSLWHDCLIVVDEANKYAPEDKGDAIGDIARSKAAIVDLMTRGRKRGFSGLLATQRISALDKNSAAECNSALIGRCVLDTDIKRAAKNLGMKATDAAEELPQMKPGEFFAYGDAFTKLGDHHGRVVRVRVGQVITTHPKRGQRVPVAPSRTEIRDRMAAFAKRAAALVVPVANPSAPAAKAEYQESWMAAVRARDAAVVERDVARARVAELTQEVTARGDTIRAIIGTLSGVVEQHTIPSHRVMVAKLADALPVDHAADREANHALAQLAAERTKHKLVKAPSNGVHKLTPAHRKILTALTRFGALPPNRLAIRTGYTTAQKGFTNYLSQLRTWGYIAGTAPVEITSSGAIALGAVDPLPTGRELLAHWLRELPPAPGRILAAIYNHHPDQPTVATIATETGYDLTQKGFTNYLSHLRSMGLIGGHDHLYTFSDMH